MTTTEATDVVLHERRGGVLIITLNRPAQKNAVNLDVAKQVAAAVDLLEADADLSVGVLTGAGGVFSAGMDLKAFAQGQLPRLPGRGFGGLTRATVRKPLIAAVEGWALGGGFEMVLACDLIVAAENARFGLPEVKRGLVAAGGGLLRLPRRVPYHLAMEWALTGDYITAERAAQVGLVNRLVAPGTAAAQAAALARVIAANGPLAVAAAKRIIVESADWPIAEQFARQRAISEPVRASQDAREGALAFREKRPPRWQGR